LKINASRNNAWPHPASEFQCAMRCAPGGLGLTQKMLPLVREMARFAHDITFFHHDVRRKRFNAHEESHNKEMIISKDHVAEKSRRG